MLYTSVPTFKTKVWLSAVVCLKVGTEVYSTPITSVSMRCYKPPCTHGGYRKKIGGYSKKVRTDMRRGGYSLRLRAHGGYRNWAIYQDPCSTGLIKRYKENLFKYQAL